MIFRAAPVWLESRISQTLREKDIVVAGFPVGRIGPEALEIRSGALLFGGHSLGWESIRVEYKFNQLVKGQLGRVSIQSPVLSLVFDPPWGGLPDNQGALLTTSETVTDAAPASPGLEVNPSVDESDAILPVASLPDTPLTLPLEPDSPVQDTIDPWEQLQALPVGLLSMNDGVVKVRLRPESVFEAGFEGDLARQPFGMAGELFMDSPGAVIHLSLRAPKAQPVITVQGGLAMPVNAVRNVANYLLEQLPDCEDYPRISSSGAFTADLFAEQTESQEVQGSAEAYLDELTLRFPGDILELTLDELVAAGYYRDTLINLEGGGDVLIPGTSQLRVEPFGVRYALRDSQRFSMESELFSWSLNGIEGRCALLGGGNLSQYPDTGWASVEASFASLAYQQIAVEPFSIQISHAAAGLTMEASPLGLVQSGTIWIEDVKGEASPDLQELNAGFSWYGLLGEALGAVYLNQKRLADSVGYDLMLSGPDGADAFHAEVRESNGDYTLNASGELQLPWINTLLRWFSHDTFSLGGAAPLFCNADLGLKDSLLSGYFDVQLRGLDIDFDSGLRMQGISSEIDGAVMILPRTLGRQVTTINKASSGPIVLEDIRLEWELKSLRELVVHHFSGRIGDGIVELEPFTVNPIRPVFNTAVVVRKFDADLLRQWLSEKRFSIDASIAGRIPIGWEDGELVLGSGKFAMDSQTAAGWLRFEDERFLNEKFAAVGGVPADLKQRLLTALWENGIQMNGMEVYMGATSNQDELSFRISVNGETASDLIEFPIGGFVLNNLISLEDLATLMNMVAPVRIDPNLGRE